jgi:predicted O-methyltransferase YrrM
MKKKGINLLDPEYSAWIQNNLLPPIDPRHEELERYSLQLNLPIIDRFGGFYLKNLIKTIKPKNILELGTGPGYSTYFMVDKTLPSYKITTIERRKENINTAKSYLDLCKDTNCTIDFIEDDIMSYLNQNIDSIKNFDFAFIDCDKVLYLEIFGFLYDKSPKIPMVFDNVFWRGRLMDPDPNAKSDMLLIQFWDTIKNLGLEYEIFPCEDGMLYLPPIFCLEN